MLQCPSCNRILMDTTNDGGVKLRTRMVLFQDGVATAICPTCKTPVEVPVVLGNIPYSLPKQKIVMKA